MQYEAFDGINGNRVGFNRDRQELQKKLSQRRTKIKVLRQQAFCGTSRRTTRRLTNQAPPANKATGYKN